ncbi:hypothetical protein ACFL6S_36400 [Candidatus Poribacteria bacterium]
MAQQIRPLDRNGKPSTDGKIIFLSIGMSNTTQEFQVFKKMADADPEKSTQVVIVDGAQGGQTAKVTAANMTKLRNQRLGLFWVLIFLLSFSANKVFTFTTSSYNM